MSERLKRKFFVFCWMVVATIINSISYLIFLLYYLFFINIFIFLLINILIFMQLRIKFFGTPKNTDGADETSKVGASV